MIRRVLKHIGYTPESSVDPKTQQLIEKAISEVENESSFKYLYDYYEMPLEFMKKNPAYSEFLSGAKGFLLCATTLGIQIDRHLKRIQALDMPYAVIFDAVASVYIEEQADKFQNQLHYEEIGFRFCPGYGGTPLSDNRIIAELLHAERIGITFLDSGVMIPMKSMMGIVRIGGSKRKNCHKCLAAQGCIYRQRGTTCW